MTGGESRLGEARRAIERFSVEDYAEAERAALIYFGFHPPNRASGDVARPLAPDPRYRRVAPPIIAARVRAITGGLRTNAPDCCAAVTKQVAADATGFSAMLLPSDARAGAFLEEKEAAPTDRWLLSPLDPTLGFVPCGYDCIAAQQARRATLAGRDFTALRAALGARLLRLAPGIDLLVTGARTRHAGLRLDGIFAIAPALPPALSHLLDALVIRRLLAGSELRIAGEEVEVRQGLVFVKMLHRSNARWLDLV